MKSLLLLLKIMLLCSVVSKPLLASASSTQLKAEALFKGSAVINIDGKRRMLKVGKQSPEGLRLIKSSPQAALVEWQGKRYRLGLSNTINSTFSKARKSRLAIQKKDNKAYYVSGTINGQTTKMLVDTGATSIAMNSVLAKRLGVDYRLRGERSRVRTASGVTDGFTVKLREVSVGGIAVKHVEAVIIEGDYPHTLLLGMSYLNHVKLEESEGVLYLEEKY